MFGSLKVDLLENCEGKTLYKSRFCDFGKDAGLIRNSVAASVMPTQHEETFVCGEFSVFKVQEDLHHEQLLNRKPAVPAGAASGTLTNQTGLKRSSMSVWNISHF